MMTAFTSPRYRSFSRLIRRLSPACLGLLVVAACGGDGGPGSLIVQFRLGNGKTCQDVGVSKIEVALSGEISQIVDCNAGTQVQFADIPSGSYEVSIRGHDIYDVVVMDNQAEADQAFAEVLSDGQTTTPEIGLTSVPAHLNVRWRFGEGFGDCTSAEIDRFEVRAWDAAGTNLLHTATIACNAKFDSMFYREVPDIERNIDGTRFSEASIVPYKLDGTPLGQPVSFVLPKTPGPGYFVKLTISCPSNTGCIASDPPLILPERP